MLRGVLAACSMKGGVEEMETGEGQAAVMTGPALSPPLFGLHGHLDLCFLPPSLGPAESSPNLLLGPTSQLVC